MIAETVPLGAVLPPPFLEEFTGTCLGSAESCGDFALVPSNIPTGLDFSIEGVNTFLLPSIVAIVKLDYHSLFMKVSQKNQMNYILENLDITITMAILLVTEPQSRSGVRNGCLKVMNQPKVGRSDRHMKKFDIR